MAHVGGGAPPTAPAVSLSDLPFELRAHLVGSLDSLRDLAAANATSRLFRGAPGGRSPVEHALRERASARGHARALPAAVPPDVCSWTEELFARERVLKLARAHALPVACSQSQGAASRFSAFVDAEGGLHTCGEEELEGENFERTGEHRPPLAVGHPGVAAVLLPTRVPSLSSVRVRSVAASCEHLLALSEAGTVYACGENDWGQLGLGDVRNRREFSPVAALVDLVVVCITAGNYHSLALTSAGCAYSWGFNKYGRLGHGDTDNRCEPTRIEALDGVRVAGLSAGGGHALFLSTCGTVYSCGYGCKGQLGHGDEQDQHTPRCIEALAGVRAVHVSAGGEHSLVVDADGGVHAFGERRAGALGFGDTSYAESPRPKRISALAGVHVVRACAGYYTSAVVGADGSVHTFGFNSHCHMGLGQATCIFVGYPVRAGFFVHKRVVACSLGHTHALYVTADGAVYVCGRYRSAALGLGVSAGDAEAAGQHWQPTDIIPTHVAQLPRIGVAP